MEALEDAPEEEEMEEDRPEGWAQCPDRPRLEPADSLRPEESAAVLVTDAVQVAEWTWKDAADHHQIELDAV